MGRADRPVEPWARPLWNVVLPPKGSRGPSRVISRGGGLQQATSHQRPSATSPSCRGPGSLHPQPWREILMRPEPCSLQTAQPYHRPRPGLSLPSLSRRLAARPPPVSDVPSRSWFSIKSQFLLSACHCAGSLIALPTEASGHGA